MIELSSFRITRLYPVMGKEGCVFGTVQDILRAVAFRVNSSGFGAVGTSEGSVIAT